MKRCPRCGDTKPLTEYHQRKDGRPAAHCKRCANRRPSSDARVIRNRARSRALEDLALEFPLEFQWHYERRLIEAEREAALLRAVVADEPPAHPETHPQPVVTPARPPAPVQLDTSRRDGRSAVERIREQCVECATFHERGHECPTCAERDAARAALAPHTGEAARVRREAVALLRGGATPQDVAKSVGQSVRWALALQKLLRTGGAV